MPPNTLRASLRSHIGLPCPYCGGPMLQPTRDHIRPVHFGCSLTDGNKAIVCSPCNHDKGHYTLKEWIRILTRAGDPERPSWRRLEPLGKLHKLRQTGGCNRLSRRGRSGYARAALSHGRK